MENSRWDPNAAMVCPYDVTHVISVKRFQRHLVKCRMNHPDKDFVTCPFNAKHMFLRGDLRKHLAHCADRITLDADVVQDEDPETGETLRLKGKTDMPRPPENLPTPSEDWDDEIEENLAEKYAWQEEYSRLQGFIARKEEEPILRRPTLPIVNKPNLPVLNKPVFSENGYSTSLRRPNLPYDEKTESDDASTVCSSDDVPTERLSVLSTKPAVHNQPPNPSVLSPKSVVHNQPPNPSVLWTKSAVHNQSPNVSATNVENNPPERLSVLSTRTPGTRFHNGVSSRDKDDNSPSVSPSVPVNNVAFRNDARSVPKDCDTESLMSDSSWVSSVYEPINRYSNKFLVNPSPSEPHNKEPYGGESNILDTSLAGVKKPRPQFIDNSPNKVGTSNDATDLKTMHGVARGNILRSLEGSAFTPVVPKQPNNSSKSQPIGRGAVALNKTASVPNQLPNAGVGRGNLKLAAMNFQIP